MLRNDNPDSRPAVAWRMTAAASSNRPAVARLIVGFQQDAEMHWVAELECGHTQHVRHDPPWQQRPWVLTREGREKFIGTSLQCVLCAANVRAVPSDLTDV